MTTQGGGVYLEYMMQQICRSKHVIWNVVDGEAVLLDTQTGVYYGMNRTASAIWELLETPKTVQEIVLEMMTRYSVDQAVLAGDVEDVVTMLRSKRLIERLQV